MHEPSQHDHARAAVTGRPGTAELDNLPYGHDGAVAGVRWQWRDGGLQLVLTKHNPSHWTCVQTVQWADTQLAAAKWRDAVRWFAAKGTQGSEVGQRTSAHRLGPFVVTVLSGPPTWWWPRVWLGKWRIGAGIARGAVVVAWLPAASRS